jgi:hypothetical protein
MLELMLEVMLESMRRSSVRRAPWMVAYGAIDGATDAVLASKVAVTIVSPSAVLAVDGGSGVDGGDTVTPVIAKTDRLAPTVRVEVQSQGGDPTLDVVTSIKATLVSETTKATSLTISLNQIQYEVIPESDSKVYIYADTPFDLSGLAGDFYTLQVTAITAGGVSASASVRIYIDGGPIITFLQPAAAAHVKGSIVVTTMVVDNRSGITGVAFSIGQYEIDPVAIATNGAQYSTTIDFGSYNPPLDGSQLVTVSATNGNGNTSLASRSFTIDNVGPTITNTSPAKGELIGKLLTINATVTDLSRGHGFLSHRGGCQWRHPLRRQPDQGVRRCLSAALRHHETSFLRDFPQYFLPRAGHPWQ